MTAGAGGWAAAALVVAALSGGCVRGAFSQVTINEPIDRSRLEALRPGIDDLGTCLAALGAPVDVREYRVGPDGRAGMALVWFWSRNIGWGIDVSAPVTRDASVSFEFDWGGTDLPGCVLWFDEELVLERWREGLVGELLPRRRRPSPAAGG